MIKVGAVHKESAFPVATRNYKISATVGVTTVISTPLRAILDTGAGPNLIREEVLPEDWSRYRVADAPFYNIVGACGKRLRQKGVITLFVQVGNLLTQARFIAVHSLAAECILGCQFIDRHVRSILPK
jgi:Retroviral aspartyl protease